MITSLSSTNYIRQSLGWSKFLKLLKWQTFTINNNQFYIKKVPFLPISIIKTAHPKQKLNFKQIDKLAKKHHSLCIIIDPHPLNFNQTTFLKNGFQNSKLRLTHTATILIDLKKTKEKILKGFSENARRNIKKAEQNNLTVEIIKVDKKNLETQFKRFITLWLSLTKMKGFKTPGPKDLHAKMTGFADNSYLFFAKNNQGQDLAVVWIIINDKLCNYAHTGINKEGYSVLANYLLVWELLKFAKKKGCTVFDFEGIFDDRYPKIGKDWKNYTEFKKRFHGETVYYPPTQIKFYSKVFKFIYSFNTYFEQ